MKKHFYAVLSITIFWVSLGFWQACKKDDLTDIFNAKTETVTTSIKGRVVNELGSPIINATVSIGSTNVTTNYNGEFLFANINASRNASLIKVSKTGYLNGFRTIMTNEGRTQFIHFELIPKNPRYLTINANTGGTLPIICNKSSLNNQSTITFPANAFVVKSTGSIYNGKVQLQGLLLDPSNENFNKLNSLCHGDFVRGINASGQEVALNDFGNFVLILIDPATDQELDLAPGKTAKVFFQPPFSQRNATSISFPLPPSTMACWFFDETVGMWKEKTVANRLANSNYEFEIAQIGSWTCSVANSFVELKAQFKDQNGNPLRYGAVTLTNGNLYPFADQITYTNDEGRINCKVLAKTDYVISVNNECGEKLALSTDRFNSGSSTKDLGVITFTYISNTSNITGNVVKCSGAPVTNGYVKLTDFRLNTHIALIENGRYNFSLPFCSLTSPTQNITLVVYDSDSAQMSIPYRTTVLPGNNTINTLTACNISTLQYVNWTVDSIRYSNTSPVDSFFHYNFTDVNGNYYQAFRSFGRTYSNTARLSFNFNRWLDPNTPHFVNFLYGTGISNYLSSLSIPIRFTEFNDYYLAGSFSATVLVQTIPTTTQNISCTFRIKRGY